jgi:hypothetical protein
MKLPRTSQNKSHNSRRIKTKRVTAPAARTILYEAFYNDRFY